VGRFIVGGGRMLALREKRDPVPSTKQFLGERPVPLGDLVQLKKAFRVALWERESNDEVLRVLDRTADDNGFVAALTYRGSDALAGYHLTSQAKAALLSGDVRWIEAHLGKLTERQQPWLQSVCANICETTLLKNLGYNGIDRGE
jgi:hypothetical protein